MKVGIIIYSQTGNTNSVARRLQEKLTAEGHTVGLEKVTITGEATPGSKDFQLNSTPEVEKYDAVVFGSPVQAFQLNPAMETYLEQIPTLAGKKTACFVTKRLPFHWTGGNQAVGKMKTICQTKGAEMVGSGIVVWSGAGREKAIEQCTENLTRMF